MLLVTAIRKERSLTMSALARLAGMHVSSISQIERGYLKPYPGQVTKIAEALNWKEKPVELFKEVNIS